MENQPLERYALDYLQGMYEMSMQEMHDKKLTPAARAAAVVISEAAALAMMHISKRITMPGLTQVVGAGIDVAEADDAVITLSAMQLVDLAGRATIAAGPSDLVHICQLNGLVSGYMQREGFDESARQIFCSPTSKL